MHGDLADLINGGVLQAGMPLVPRRKAFRHLVVTLLQDGQIDVDVIYPGTTEAAAAITGKKRASGWGFFLVAPDSGRSLNMARNDYVATMAVDDEEDEDEDEDDEG